VTWGDAAIAAGADGYLDSGSVARCRCARVIVCYIGGYVGFALLLGTAWGIEGGRM
jgi:hypothetical protein